MKQAHRALIARYREVKSQLTIEDNLFLFWRFREDDTRRKEALSLPPQAQKRLADSYREAEVKPLLDKLHAERARYVRDWCIHKKFAKISRTALPLTGVAFLLNGIEKDRWNGRIEWGFAVDPMLERRMLWLVIPLIAIMSFPIKITVSRLCGRNVDAITIFSLLTAFLCLLEITALF